MSQRWRPFAALHHAIRAPTAGRADEPLWPPRRDDDGLTLLLGAIAAGEFSLARPFWNCTALRAIKALRWKLHVHDLYHAAIG